MNDTSLDIQTLPTFLFVLCAMSAMAFVVSTNMWLIRQLRQPGQNKGAFLSAVLAGQGHSLVFVLCLSAITGALHQGYDAQKDLVILVGVISGVLAVSKIKNQTYGTFRFLRRVWFFGLGCVLGWSVTLIVCFSAYQALNIIFGAGLAVFISVFMSFVVWAGPAFIFHSRLRQVDACPPVKGYALLMTFFMAYFMLFLPLKIQQVINSDEWQAMKYAKPPVRIF